jgi:hypothetical protein
VIVVLQQCIYEQHNIIETRFAMLLLDIQRRTDGLQPFAILMAELGWAAVRGRDLTLGGYKESVRGYVRRH